MAATLRKSFSFDTLHLLPLHLLFTISTQTVAMLMLKQLLRRLA